MEDNYEKENDEETNYSAAVPKNDHGRFKQKKPSKKANLKANPFKWLVAKSRRKKFTRAIDTFNKTRDYMINEVHYVKKNFDEPKFEEENLIIARKSKKLAKKAVKIILRNNLGAVIKVAAASGSKSAIRLQNEQFKKLKFFGNIFYSVFSSEYRESLRDLKMIKTDVTKELTSEVSSHFIEDKDKGKKVVDIGAFEKQFANYDAIKETVLKAADYNYFQGKPIGATTSYPEPDKLTNNESVNDILSDLNPAAQQQPTVKTTPAPEPPIGQTSMGDTDGVDVIRKYIKDNNIDDGMDPIVLEALNLSIEDATKGLETEQPPVIETVKGGQSKSLPHSNGNGAHMSTNLTDTLEEAKKAVGQTTARYKELAMQNQLLQLYVERKRTDSEIERLEKENADLERQHGIPPGVDVLSFVNQGDNPPEKSRGI